MCVFVVSDYVTTEVYNQHQGKLFGVELSLNNGKCQDGCVKVRSLRASTYCENMAIAR